MHPNVSEWVTPLEPEISRLAVELGSPQRIFDFMRQVRYVTDYYLKKPIEVLHSLVGDCDEQAVLLCSLLRAIGEEAYVRVAEFPGRPVLHAYVVWFDVAYQVWRNLDPSGTINFEEDLSYGDEGGVPIVIYVDFNDKEVIDYGGLGRIEHIFQER